MKKAPQNDEWSVEPVRGTEPDASVVGLIRLLEILEHHLVELQTKRNAAALRARAHHPLAAPMDSGLTPIPSRSELSRAGLQQLPAVVLRAGEQASKRFLEFFAASIRNPHTRRAYLRAAVAFFEWCEQRRLRELAAIEPLHVAAYIEYRGRAVTKPSVKQELAALRMLFDWFVVRTVGVG